MKGFKTQLCKDNVHLLSKTIILNLQKCKFQVDDYDGLYILDSNAKLSKVNIKGWSSQYMLESKSIGVDQSFSPLLDTNQLMECPVIQIMIRKSSKKVFFYNYIKYFLLEKKYYVYKSILRIGPLNLGDFRECLLIIINPPLAAKSLTPSLYQSDVILQSSVSQPVGPGDLLVGRQNFLVFF